MIVETPLTRPQSSNLSDEALLDLVQRQTFRFFWEGAHPLSFLARDRTGLNADASDDLISIGGSGFGVMAIIVAVARGWIEREAAVARLNAMIAFLERTPSYHGLFPHFMNGRTGATIPFGRKDDGADIVETAFLFQGLLCARQFFDGDGADEKSLRDHITWMWSDAEWNWHTRDGRKALTWHWSPNNGFALDAEIRGWNECLIAYVLAAASPRHTIDPAAYHGGFAQSRVFINRRSFYDLELPLGPDFGGPLFFAHYSFCGLDPRGLRDDYADYWRQNVQHTLINYEHCVRNPNGHKGYGPSSWGLTASDDPSGYMAHAPDNDNGVISPTAALSSFAYAPQQSMRAMRHFHDDLGEGIWGRFGFVDAFSETHGWRAETYLAIDQGPIVVMIENFRSGLMWRLFMGDLDVQRGLRRLGFQSPHICA
ncbi:Beta-glucosidase [Methylocella tundrae]|uniref:Beta-glucosidase n=1 Tax=Methylocella tundrae TaxID=227605 RepID=A0A4U8YZW6_METTU|nr:Beta-glucosidase [Methylocella tundrae]